jgi:hypothetical protein
LRQIEEFAAFRRTETFAEGSYVELRTCEVPCGWSNHPRRLGVNIHFTGETDNIRDMLKADYNLPNARPILLDRQLTYILDGGDGKYYMYNHICGDLGRIEEPDLRKILAKLGREGLSGIKYTILVPIE